MASEAIQGDAWETYVVLERTLSTERGIAYGRRRLGRRSLHSSSRQRKAGTWRREAGDSTQ